MVHKQEVINKTKWFSTSEEHSQFREWFRSSLVFICWEITEKKITILSNAYIHIYVESDGLQSMGLQRVRYDWSDLAHMHMPWYMIHGNGCIKNQDYLFWSNLAVWNMHIEIKLFQNIFTLVIKVLCYSVYLIMVCVEKYLQISLEHISWAVFILPH